MSGSESDTDRDAHVADALGEVLRSLAHDAANCAAVFDMELGDLQLADGDEAAASLRSATDRLREHVQDLRVLAGARSTNDCALDEVTRLVLRLSSRSARRDLGQLAPEVGPMRVKVPQVHAALVMMVTLRGILVAGRASALLGVSLTREEGRAVVTALADLEPGTLEAIAERGRTTAGAIAVITADRIEVDGRSRGRLRIAFPLA